MRTEVFIKKIIFDDRHGTYTMIVSEYQQEINRLGATNFCFWLEMELEIPKGTINIHSLRSALRRSNSKKMNTQIKTKETSEKGALLLPKIHTEPEIGPYVAPKDETFEFM